MKTIKKRFVFLVMGSGVGVCTILFVVLRQVHEEHSYTLLTTALVMMVLLFTFLVRDYRSYQAARLIVENKIMQILIATIEEGIQTGQDGTSPIRRIEVVISCFGILLDSRVIKFNVNKICLHNVEIGRESISFTYGKAQWTRRICILHGVIDRQELQDYIDRFRYETGVVPVTTDL